MSLVSDRLTGCRWTAGTDSRSPAPEILDRSTPRYVKSALSRTRSVCVHVDTQTTGGISSMSNTCVVSPHSIGTTVEADLSEGDFDAVGRGPLQGHMTRS
ncbi:hypothetical protein PISMIDRAFT_595690 [Pisolithus microcarpus 441]|uniref:Uncharacterized protein n=1 Tax=Pisolithus microcarpus 441 TaxID=765257 RepID=A0A0C9Z1Y9_9AGAM|nr:hypothetical protein PISMIDRAFT_595690 [Pisolithus microcarpus 441]